VAANSLTLTWAASTGTAPITYQPLFRVTGATSFLPFGSPISGLTVVVTGLVASTSYDFEITASNSFGSTTSTLVTGTTNSGNAFPIAGKVAGSQNTGSVFPIIAGPQNGSDLLNTALAVTGITITDTAATTGTLVVSCTSGGVAMKLNGVAVTNTTPVTTFADEFTSIPLHQPWQSGDKWQLIAPDTQNGRGGTNFGESGTQWWVNPFNASTPNSTMYTVVNGQLRLQIQNTPSGSQSYINTQSGSTLPYEGALLNSSTTNYQKFGYYEMAVAVDRINGFGWLFCIENVQITGHWPPEIDLLISTNGTNVQTVQFKINLTANSPVYSISSADGFDASVQHVYGIDWQSDAITFYIDGSQMYRVANPGGVYATDQMFIFLATYANYPSGVNPASTSLPASALIDYLRVYQTKPPPVTTLTLTDTFANIKSALASLVYIAPGTATVDTISVKFTDQASATNTLLIQIQDVAAGTAVAPSAPTGLTAGTATNTSMQLNWVASSTGTAPISYQPLFKLHTDTTFASSGSPVSGLTATISGLTAGASYDFEVTASNSAGSATSTVVTASTTNATVAPSAPTNLQTLSTTSTSLTVSWSPPATGTAPITYQPQVRVTGSSLTTKWYESPGQDQAFWRQPFYSTAKWITSGSVVDLLRNSNHGSPYGTVNLKGNYSVPWVIGQATDPLVQVTDGTKSINVRIPLGTILEGPSSSVDQSIGGADASQPYLVWSISGATCNTGAVAATGSVITGTYGFTIQDGTGPDHGRHRHRGSRQQQFHRQCAGSRINTPER
jgi:hypothetical protein